MWKKIKGFENYEVNKNGVIRNVKTKKVLSQFKSKDGYLQVMLYPGRKTKTVHRIVAECWIDNINNLPEVEHISTIKEDCSVNNLRWCTHKENMNNPITKKKQSDSMKGNTNGLGHRWTDKQRENLSSSKTGVKLSEKHCKSISKSKKGNTYRRKKIKCIESNEVFDSVQLASEKYKINPSHIAACANGKRKTCGGYHWQYV